MKRTRTDLLLLAKQAKKTRYHNLSKHRLVELLFSGAVKKIETYISKRLRYKPINDVDPISQVELDSSPFLLISENGVVTGFDPEMLRHCVQKTNNAINPITQDKLNIVELRRLEKATGGEKIVLLADEKRDDEIHSSLCVALERQVGNTVQEFLDELEENKSANHIAAMHKFLPELISSISNYTQVDPVGCVQIIDHCLDRTFACKTTATVHLEFVGTVLSNMKEKIANGEFFD